MFNIDSNLILAEASKTLTYGTLAFVIGMWWAPILINFLVKIKFWKKKSRTQATTGEALEVTKKFYQENEVDKKVPRAGGLLITLTTIGFALVTWLVLQIDLTSKTYQFVNFISRRQTFIPLATLFFGSAFGLIDDALSTMENGGNYFAGGLKLGTRAAMVLGLSFAVGLWIFLRLGLTSLSIFFWNIDFSTLNLPFALPLIGSNLGWLIIPATMIIITSLWGTSVIDGFDGIAVGTFIPIYLCFAGVAFATGYFDIATLLMVMAGSMGAYLWYNIPPARFYLGDTGAVGILLTLGTVAILIDAVEILPIAGFMLVLTGGSVLIQITSKKLFGKKVFLAAPLHHHLEAIGWKREQITMRYWLVSIMTSVLGLAIGLLFR
jgi:phospho-N-acetylmuramoyl-pentapeptide-transferase